MELVAGEEAPGRSLVGRDREMGVLRAAVARAAAGEPGIVLVAGETGVGKTALVRALIADGTTTPLYGGCLPAVEEALPFAPLIQALRRLGNTGTVRQQVARSPELTRLVPSWGAASEASGSADVTSSTKLVLFQAVFDLIDKLGAAAPTLHVVEDIHWSDRSTLDLVRYLATNLLRERVLLLVTYRDHDIPAGSPVASWLAELARLPIVERLAVHRLDAQHALELASRIAGTDPHPMSADRLSAAVDRAAGNPLFLEHLVRPGAPTDALPVTLQELLLARVGVLSQQAVRVLEVLSTLGRAAPAELVAQVLERAVPDVEAHAHAAIEQAVLEVRADGTLGFAHPAFGEAVWSGMLPSERSRLHRGCAEILAAAPNPVPGELARHWLGAGDAAQALSASVAAGEAAKTMYAFTDAQRAFERSLGLADVLGRTELRRDLCARSAQAAYLAGSTDAAIGHALASLEAPGDVPPDSELAERLGAYHFVAGRGPEAEEWYLRALDALPPQEDSGNAGSAAESVASVLAATIYAEMACLLAGWSRADEAEDWAGRGLQAAQATGARRAEGLVRNAMGMVALLRGDVEDAIGQQRRALDIATEIGGADDVALAYVNLTHSLGQAGRLDEVAAVAREGSDVVARAGLATQFGGLLRANAVEALINRGRLDDAAAVVAETIGREPRGITAAPALLQAGRLAMARGELDIARDRCEQARLVMESESAPEAWLRVAAESAAEVELWAGRFDAAYEIVVEALDLITGTGEEPFRAMLVALGLRALADRADVHRDPVSRKQIKDALTPLDDAFSGGVNLPTDAAVQAWCDAERRRIELDAAPDAWRACATAWATVGHTLNGAYAAWREAEARLDRGVNSEAIDAIRRAYDSAMAIGLPVLARELERLAGWHRIDLVTPPGPAVAATTPGGDALAAYQLTERELEVLALVAAGRTNGEIAAGLFISVKTASVHVSNILRKLEVSSRQEAARVAHRLGMR